MLPPRSRLTMVGPRCTMQIRILPYGCLYLGNPCGWSLRPCRPRSITCLKRTLSCVSFCGHQCATLKPSLPDIAGLIMSSSTLCLTIGNMKYCQTNPVRSVVFLFKWKRSYRSTKFYVTYQFSSTSLPVMAFTTYSIAIAHRLAITSYLHIAISIVCLQNYSLVFWYHINCLPRCGYGTPSQLYPMNSGLSREPTVE